MESTLALIAVIGPVAFAAFFLVGILPTVFLKIGSSRKSNGAYRAWTAFGFIAFGLFILGSLAALGKEGIAPAETIGHLLGTILGIFYVTLKARKYIKARRISQQRSPDAA